MRSWRAMAKFLRVIAWVLRGYWMVRTTFPQLSDEQQARAVEVWARGMLAIIGIEVRVKGHSAPGPVLMAANHISWLDILVMHAACHCRFVAKSEIRSWPLVGVLTTGGGSLYIERGSRNDAMRVVHRMAEALQAGQVLAAFPEGRTGDGITLLPPTISLAATPVDSDRSIASVSFYAGSRLLTTLTGSPWTYSWGNAPVGTFPLTAVAAKPVGNAGGFKLQTEQRGTDGHESGHK